MAGGAASNSTLPAHYALSRAQLIFSGASIVVASVLLVAAGSRLAWQIDVGQWWVPIAFVAGMAAADFGSGIVHWAADTWGRDDLPVVGRRLLVPFRIHHVNPDDFLRRPFIETNGDVAFVSVPLVAGLLLLPINSWTAPLAVFGFAFCGIGMMTNQIHQWAHMAAPPTAVRLLQQSRLILGRAEHEVHHARPYDAHYCITTGWMNRPLEVIGFFRRAEAGITWLTGAQPRQDDRRYEVRHSVTFDF